MLRFLLSSLPTFLLAFTSCLCAAQPTPFPPTNPVLVNQSGYDLAWPKRFTAPLAKDGTKFQVMDALGQLAHEGQIQGGVGDFSALRPLDSDAQYIVVVEEHEGVPGAESDPFRIAPNWLHRVSLAPALQFMIDCRSLVGTHPSAHGGQPWRDGAYYTFEVPSLILLYLANPAFFNTAPIELTYTADKKRILHPGFKPVKALGDQGAFETTKRIYTELDPLVGAEVPDIVQLIHFAIGWMLIAPESKDPSGDPKPRQIHSQTVEQFAFFLWGLPTYGRYFTQGFRNQARDFVLANWDKAGLYNVDKTLGTFKGRDCPGHSILPNLLMFEVAKRDDLPNPQRYLDAAVAQAKWVVDELDPADPFVTKGQRLSEHKLITGLVALAGDYPNAAPAGLATWLDRWTDVVIARAANPYDFRKYDDTYWTLPRELPGQTGGGKAWNEVGNVAAFPGLCFAVADAIKDPKKKQRLIEIGVAHYDALFGRNPLAAHSSARKLEDWEGAERPFPKEYKHDSCARLELVRGTLSSSPGHENYPYNPNAEFRHLEGWSGFNAAFNVGLAYTQWFGPGKTPARHVPTPTK